MIKRYDQFVNGRIDENTEEGETKIPEESLNFSENSEEKQKEPRKNYKKAEAEVEEDEDIESESEVEEEDDEIFRGPELMSELAKELGADVSTDGSINYQGKKINFYSEDNKFHVDKKKFSQVSDVLRYLLLAFALEKNVKADIEASDIDKQNPVPRREHTNSEADQDSDEMKEDEIYNESKSYRRTRFKK